MYFLQSTALFIFFPLLLFSQDKAQIELIHADALEGNERLGKNVFRLTGNVQFRHQNVLMYCDSAYRFSEENRFDAFGNIHINKGDSVHLYGDLLKYDGTSGIARLFNNVSMTDQKMNLTTENLNYDTKTEVADYYNGGKIIDGQNILTSRKGYYYSNSKTLFFKDSVLLVNPRYTMTADTLKYNTDSETAFFLGPTLITSKETDSTYIYCEYGWYNTETEKSYFSKNAYIQSKDQRMSGDSLLYDRKIAVGRAYKNVQIFDHQNKMIISGGQAIYDERQQHSLVTGRALLTQIFDNDSLYLHADTLFAIGDSVTGQKKYFAYHHCRIYKTDMQGKCDSLTYAPQDSMLRLYSDPLLWNDENQLSGDTITLQMANSEIDRMNLYNAAFITAKVDELRYNQIRGKNMTGFFTDNKLHKIEVSGNGQTIYYVKDKKKDREVITGVNRAECSDMVITIKENKVNKIILLKQPEGIMYPIEELKPEELKLKGFSWQQEKRPVSREDIFTWK